MRRHRSLVLGLTTGLFIALLAVGCGHGDGKTAGLSPSPSTHLSSRDRSDLSVSSSIRSGAVLTRPLVWHAEVSGDATVDRVEFLIDGHRRWTESTPPYEFNEGRLFTPWPLGQGRHTLAVRVVASSGATARDTATVTVAEAQAAAALPPGTYHRTVTRADSRRVLPYRDTAHGAFGDPTSTGRWVMRVRTDGVLVLDLRQADHYDGFYLPYRVSGPRLTLDGPAVWLQPHPDQPSIFCDPEPSASYTWSLHEGRLTISAMRRSCADRDAVFVGTWQRG